MKKIKNCPFCGGKAEFQHVGAQAGRYNVKCQNCWSKSIYVSIENKQEAINNWNIRATEDRLVEALKRISEIEGPYIGDVTYIAEQALKGVGE